MKKIHPRLRYGLVGIGSIAQKAVQAGVHVLCEKPLCMREEECLTLHNLALDKNLKFMVAYRLHLERANLKAIEVAHSGIIGDVKYFSSCFSFQLKQRDNIRLKQVTGGGPIWDIGIYCINAARSIFKEEPKEVFAFFDSCGQKRFAEVEEISGVTMRFSEGRIANFVCSFGASEASYYEVYGSKGHLRLNNAYEYQGRRSLEVRDKNHHQQTTHYKASDQFAAELIYFSNCVHSNRQPELSALEGLADTRIIAALHESAKSGKAVKLQTKPQLQQKARPQIGMRMRYPATSRRVSLRLS